MSSFQSFKSFVKIDQNNNDSQPAQKPSEQPENKQKDDEEISFKQFGMTPAEQSVERPFKRSKKPGSVCNFISKVYSMLDENEIQHIVGWARKQPLYSSKLLENQRKNQLGQQNIQNSFQILDIQKFQEIVLPKYFKHSNMSSFVRQLNMYGFHKLRGDKGNYEFQHEKFQRYRKDLLPEIRRKNPEFVGVSSPHLQETWMKNSFQNLRAVDQKITNEQGERFPNTQQQFLSFRSELNENNLFPTEGFFPLKRISQEDNGQIESQNSFQKQKIKKLNLVQQENNRLKRIKMGKLQKIKDLNSVNKSKIQIKFSKIVFSFLTHKIHEELKKRDIIKCSDVNAQTQSHKHQSLNDFSRHIMGSQQPESFQTYRKQIQQLIKSQQQNQSASFE